MAVIIVIMRLGSSGRAGVKRRAATLGTQEAHGSTRYPATEGVATVTSQPDPTPPTRAAIEQAKVNDDAIGLYFFQLVAAAVVGGVYFQSWFVGGGTFFALFACSYINGIKHIVAGVFVLAWAALGWEIGTLFDQEAARYVVGGVGLLLGLGINRAALQWIADMNQRR